MQIFNCHIVRACHIELIPEMSTNQFCLAFARFCNIYGVPTNVYSDNAKSFIAGINMIAVVFRSSTFKERFGMHNIAHIRIPLFSPWIDATWKRLIRTIKGCLRKTIGRSKLDYFCLLTILSDIQHTVNNRPLTYRCANDDTLEVLTPNHFLNPNLETVLIFKDPKQVIPQSMSRK